MSADATKLLPRPNQHPKGIKIMNLLESIKAQREKLDAKVNAAIAERDAFLASISDAAGHSNNRKHPYVSSREKANL